MKSPRTLLTLLLLITLAGCSGADSAAGSETTVAGSSEPPPTNRVDVPLAVRRNLGITFATVERRRVEQTLRVPGRFEPQPPRPSASNTCPNRHCVRGTYRLLHRIQQRGSTISVWALAPTPSFRW